MKNHWATFITLADFQRVAQAGVSHIRLVYFNFHFIIQNPSIFRVPVGYWYWDVELGEPYPAPNMADTDQYSPLYYLKQAFLWAAQTGMKVEI